MEKLTCKIKPSQRNQLDRKYLEIFNKDVEWCKALYIKRGPSLDFFRNVVSGACFRVRRKEPEHCELQALTKEKMYGPTVAKKKRKRKENLFTRSLLRLMSHE